MRSALVRLTSLVGQQAGASGLPALQVGPGALARTGLEQRCRCLLAKVQGAAGLRRAARRMQAVACALLPRTSRAFATNSHDIFNMVSPLL